LEEQTEYRVGSPFGEEPATTTNGNTTTTRRGDGSPPAALTSGLILESAGPEALGDGVWGQTAESAVFASIILIAFAATCWFLFPPGGIAVASLGFAVSMLALASKRTKLATTMLAIHGALFILCYLRSI
jgi:hypothetical protein